MGSGTLVDGLACTPISPASLSVQVAAGAIYTPVTTDASAYGSLGTDAHVLMKQGLVLDPTTLTFVAPTTSGQSQVFLIQASYSDYDTNLQTLSYFNSANPSVPFTGPGNTGAQQPTTRKGLLVLSTVNGVAATTGSQVAPSPTTGAVGLYTVTLAYGQTTINAGQIVQLATAPFITRKLGSPVPPTVKFSGFTITATSSSFTLSAGTATVKLAGSQFTYSTATSSSPITKTAAAFSAGNNGGSLDTGTVANSSHLHVYVVLNPSTGAVDVVTSLSATAPALPSGFTFAVLAGFIYITSSGTIRIDTWIGDTCIFGAVYTDFTGGPLGTTPTTITHTVPAGIVLQVFGNDFGTGNGDCSAVHEHYAEITYPTSVIATLRAANVASGIWQGNARFTLYTNTSGQTRVASGDGLGTLIVETHGVIYPRGIPQ